MKPRVRRLLVTIGVIVCLVLGVASIQVAAALTAAAAPPPAPPISMSELQARLTAEQARAASLQQQLDALLEVTTELTDAIETTGDQVTTDGLTAAELRARLKEAQDRLALVNRLLKEANERLAKLGAVTHTPPPASGAGSGGNGGNPAQPTPRPTARPTPRPSGFTLALSLGGGGVIADWTACSAAGFDSYALVRSRDQEIHYPPEDLDTLVARISSASTTAVTDIGAASGSNWYRVYCLTRSDGEVRTAASTATQKINVP
jgi:hypothetical protein